MQDSWEISINLPYSRYVVTTVEVVGKIHAPTSDKSIIRTSIRNRRFNRCCFCKVMKLLNGFMVF